MSWTIKDVARLTGVTPRTLRHYEKLGLLTPDRQSNGYRVYRSHHLERLQEVLFFREVGMELLEIREVLDAPEQERQQALYQVRERLSMRQQRLTRLMSNLDRAIDAFEKGEKLMDAKDDSTLEAMFDGFDPGQYEEEVVDRWGESDAYRESAARTRRYKPEDWRIIRQEQEAIYDDAYGLLFRGMTPDETVVQQLVVRHREFISRWFYTCSVSMHHELARMYVGDERFARAIEGKGGERPGLVAFMSEAILAS